MLSKAKNYPIFFSILFVLVLFSVMIMPVFTYEIFSEDKNMKSIDGEINLEYSAEGSFLSLLENDYATSSSYIASHSVKIEFNDQEIEISHHGHYSINIFTEEIENVYVINQSTNEVMNMEGFVEWYVLNFDFEIHSNTNFSDLPIILLKSHQESIQILGKNILCQVYIHSINLISETLCIRYFYDSDTGILIKYDVRSLKNLFSSTISELVIVESSYQFKNMDQISSFYFNYSYIIVSIIIGAAVGVLSIKILHDRDKNCIKK
jgi:hypothetical protein